MMPPLYFFIKILRRKENEKKSSRSIGSSYGSWYVSWMRQFRKTGFGECNQPFDFYAYACIHEGVFGKDPAQGIALAGIAAVERRESGKRIKRHDWRFLKVQKGTKTGRQLRSERTEIGFVREIAPF